MYLMEEISISFPKTERRRAKCAAKRDTISGNIKEKGFHVSARNPPAFLIAREGTGSGFRYFFESLTDPDGRCFVMPTLQAYYNCVGRMWHCKLVNVIARVRFAETNVVPGTTKAPSLFTGRAGRCSTNKWPD